MKKLALLIFLLTAFTLSSNAQGKFGLGIILGEPTGISMKVKLSGNSAVDGALGYSFLKYGSVHIHADYLQEITKLGSEVPFYIGVGGRIKTNNSEKKEDTRFGVRVPVGINFEPKSTPIELFLEFVPVMDLTPATDFSINAAAGVRYYFN